ncbi:hypothetical protein ACH42_16120 [Endozoicomonas sp. (ex Bugula neritina AB1)]|nr:hypothetical protein ACH42_16120 [Endozoicomonas sp. (ex Bugula neritina AB1)]
MGVTKAGRKVSKANASEPYLTKVTPISYRAKSLSGYDIAASEIVLPKLLRQKQSGEPHNSLVVKIPPRESDLALLDAAGVPDDETKLVAKPLDPYHTRVEWLKGMDEWQNIESEVNSRGECPMGEEAFDRLLNNLERMDMKDAAKADLVALFVGTKYENKALNEEQMDRYTSLYVDKVVEFSTKSQLILLANPNSRNRHSKEVGSKAVEWATVMADMNNYDEDSSDNSVSLAAGYANSVPFRHFNYKGVHCSNKKIRDRINMRIFEEVEGRFKASLSEEQGSKRKGKSESILKKMRKAMKRVAKDTVDSMAGNCEAKLQNRHSISENDLLNFRRDITNKAKKQENFINIQITKSLGYSEGGSVDIDEMVAKRTKKWSKWVTPSRPSEPSKPVKDSKADEFSVLNIKQEVDPWNQESTLSEKVGLELLSRADANNLMQATALDLLSKGKSSSATDNKKNKSD